MRCFQESTLTYLEAFQHEREKLDKWVEEIQKIDPSFRVVVEEEDSCRDNDLIYVGGFDGHVTQKERQEICQIAKKKVK